MMRLDDMRKSGNVDDRRYRSGGVGSAGGLLRLLPLIRALLRTKSGWAVIAPGVAVMAPLAFRAWRRMRATCRVS